MSVLNSGGVRCSSVNGTLTYCAYFLCLASLWWNNAGILSLSHHLGLPRLSPGEGNQKPASFYCFQLVCLFNDGILDKFSRLCAAITLNAIHASFDVGTMVQT